MKEATAIQYDTYSQMLKAMADPNRLKIIDLLSCGTLCACDILTHFDFSQPTLSHHMKVLQAAGIVTARKEGRWQHYTLAPTFIEAFQANTAALLANDADCVCHQSNCACKGKDVDHDKN